MAPGLRRIDEHAALQDQVQLMLVFNDMAARQEEVAVFQPHIPGQGLPQLDLGRRQSQELHTEVTPCDVISAKTPVACMQNLLRPPWR
jgi:hypothetical protein